MTAMGWFITAYAGEFLAEAGEFLRADPVRNTVMLTVTENLRVKAAASTPAAAPGSGLGEPLFGCWRPTAVEQDRDLLAVWFDAFAGEVGDPPGSDNRAVVGDQVLSLAHDQSGLRFTRERT